MSSVIEQAKSHIAAAKALKEKALSHLKAESLSGEKVSGAKLDEKQLACYEIAYCAAEINAAEVYLDYSQSAKASAGGENRIEEKIALQYCAEALQNCRGRFNTRRAEFGLTRDDINSSLDSDEIDTFINTYLSSESMVAIAKEILEHDGFMGEYLLKDLPE